MFGVYFGKYLEKQGILTSEQVNELLEENRTARLKMGFLAVEQGYMTTAQADEVNMLQQMQDKRFGDIAVEKGYLTDAQVGELLKKQGDAYLIFVQSLIEHDYMNLEQIQKYLNAYKKSERLTSLDLDAIKSSDIDKIVQVYTKEPAIPPVVKDFIALTARNLIRFVDNNLYIDKVERMNDYSADYIASQNLEGEYKLFTGFAGDGQGIKVIAEAYGKEIFDTVDEDVLDACCEFLNCNNGLFATKLSHEDIELDMVPPVMYLHKTKICSDGNVFRVPFTVQGKTVDLIVCIETKWTIC